KLHHFYFLLCQYRDLQGSTDEQSVSEKVEDVEASTNYCVTIKIFSSDKKNSDPSEKRCLVTHPAMDSGESAHWWLLFALCLISLGLFGLAAIIVLHRRCFLSYL
uniref:Interferon/interleukin receptor domain-containing protein n=1 Tax=Callorhinchus milii TaxID=7868 RepID=A0A4W3JAU9_CALMI